MITKKNNIWRRIAVLFGAAVLFTGDVTNSPLLAAESGNETENDVQVVAEATAPEEAPPPETAPETPPETAAEVPDPGSVPETPPPGDSPAETSDTQQETAEGNGSSPETIPQTETTAAESEVHPENTETGQPATETEKTGNHSVKIPENPDEDMAISRSDIVDAGEEYWESLEDETENIEAGGNEDGSAIQGSYSGRYWDPSWVVTSRYRFRKVDKVRLLSEADASYVYEKPDFGADTVGKIPQFGIAYLLQSEDNGWAYIESGDVRGFARTDAMQMKNTEGLIDAVGDEAFATAYPLCEKSDNEAYTYTMTTVQEVYAEKEFALMIRPGGIYEYADEKSRKVGEGESGAVVFILSRAENGWLFVESGNVRGFVDPGNLIFGPPAQVMVEDTGEDAFPGISEKLDPEENRSFYYTLASTQRAADELGEEIAEYAISFVGRIGYVWGGCSLESGCDCSGFVLSIYKSFGISLPRLAEEIGISGQEIGSLSDANPGDVIYWGRNPHVGIYLGNGKVVQCQGNSSNTANNPGQGPTISDATYMPITSIRRFLIEQDESQAEGGSRTDPTPYTDEELELIWAIVAQEDNGSYEGALAVITSAMNRTESDKWGFEGGNALTQLTAPGQYCYSNDSYWIPRLNGNVPDYVKQAVNDCLKRGIRNHNHTSFRSTKGKTTGSDAIQVGGNWYFDS